MEKTMNYIDAMDFLEETKKYGSQLGLTSIQNLMAELGNIQDKIPLVHIGGTNGKGSVGAMLSQVLTEAGYRVGRFCTPDVFVYEDEFQMNGINIEKGRLAQLFTRVKAACEKWHILPGLKWKPRQPFYGFMKKTVTWHCLKSEWAVRQMQPI